LAHSIDAHAVEDRSRGDLDALGVLAVPVAEELFQD
jgi:hypothetical protein